MLRVGLGDIQVHVEGEGYLYYKAANQWSG